jgi:hypothetical protein
MKFSSIYILLIPLVACNEGLTNKVPKQTASIEIDGILKDTEWGNSKIISSNESVQIMLTQNDSFFYIGVRKEKEIARYVDVYIYDGTKLLNLHASMQLGERLLQGDWNDTIPTWNWGNNKLWTANHVSIVSKDEQLPFSKQTNAYDGYEFIIKKEMIENIELKLMLEIKDFTGEQSMVIFPDRAIRHNYSEWFTFKL